MTIDGIENVKERKEIFRKKEFITYTYYLENGNHFNSSVPTWKQRDFGNEIIDDPDKRLEKRTRDNQSKYSYLGFMRGGIPYE